MFKCVRLALLLTAAGIGLSGCGGGGSTSESGLVPPVGQNPPASAPAPAPNPTLNLTTTAVTSYDDLKGSVANAKRGSRYSLRYDLGSQVRTEVPLNLDDAGAFTTVAPAGAFDPKTLVKSGDIPARLIETSGTGVVTELNAQTLTVTLYQSPSSLPLGTISELYAQLQLAVEANAAEDEVRFQVRGFDPFASIDFRARSAFWQQLLNTIDAVVSSGKPVQFKAPNGNGTFIVTPEVVAVLDQQFLLFLHRLPPPVTMTIDSIAGKVAISAGQNVAPRPLSSVVRESTEAVDLIGWARKLGEAGKMVQTAGLSIAATGVATAVVTGGAAIPIAQPAIIVGMGVFCVGVAMSVTDSAVEGVTQALMNGKSSLEDYSPSLSMLAQLFDEKKASKAISDGENAACGHPCSFGDEIDSAPQGLFDSAQSTARAQFDNGTLPVGGLPTRSTVRLSVSVGHSTNQADFSIRVFYDPSPMPAAVSVRVSVLDADGKILFSAHYSEPASFTAKANLTRAQACAPFLRFVAWDENGPALAHMDVPAREFCDDDSGAAGAKIEEYIDWSVNGVNIAHVVPARKYLLHEGVTTGPIALDLTAFKVKPTDPDTAAPDISIDISAIVPGGPPAPFNTVCSVQNVDSLNIGLIITANAQFDALLKKNGQLPAPYQMNTCNYVSRHNVSAGEVMVSVDKTAILDDLTTLPIETYMQVAHGSFTFTVSDPDAAIAGGFALGDRVVTGTFQFKLGTCALDTGGQSSTCPLQ